MQSALPSLAVMTLLFLSSRAAVADFPNGHFVDARPVPNVNTPENFEIAPFVTNDGLELFFVRGMPGASFTADIWVSRRDNPDQEFGVPVELDPSVNTGAGEFFGSLSADALTIYFTSPRSAVTGQADIWTASRPSRDAPFQNAVELENVNTPSIDGSPFISDDDLTLYFVRDEGPPNNDDIWVATRSSPDEPFGKATPLDGINGPSDDFNPTVTRDELTILWSDWFGAPPRAGGLGDVDIWYATRNSTNDAFGDVANIGAPINSSSDDGNLMLTSDWPLTGSSAYFVSNRPGAPGEGDIWQATWVLTGDYNGQNGVEQGDLDLVLLNWGEDGTTPPEGWVSDVPSGVIDQEELDHVLLNWGTGASVGAVGGTARVPEPKAWLLALVACLVGTLLRFSSIT